MVKSGKVTLLEKNYPDETLFFAWSEVSPTFERLDVFEVPANYNMVDTSTCVAAYYRKKEELILGDKSVIKRIMRIKSIVSMCYAPTETNVEVIDGKVVLTQTKMDDNQGIYYEMNMITGFVSKEVFTCNEGTIEVYSYDNTDDSAFEPINIGTYERFNVLPNMCKGSSQGGEFHSYDYLMQHFPTLRNLLDEDYVIVDSMEVYKERLELFKTSDFYLRTVDIESTGLDVNYKGKDYITGVVLSYGRHNSTYYPFFQDDFEFNLPFECLQEIFDAVNSLPKNIKVIAHNALMELKSFRHDLGKFIRIDIDTMLLSILVNPVIRRGLHGLKPLAESVTGQQFIELRDIFIGEIQFNKLPPEIVKVYACPDGPNPIVVYEHLIKLLPKNAINLSLLEYKLTKVKAYNEYYGLRANVAKLQKLIEVEQDKVTRLRDHFQKIHRISSNINSPDVKREIFYNVLRCPVTVRTNTGQPSTSVQAIEDIVNGGKFSNPDADKIPPIADKDGKVVIKGEDLANNKYPSLVILQNYSKANKECTSLNRIKKKCHGDRIQFYISQLGTESGRQSSDAHQYSDSMKSVVISDSDDHWFWSCDWKQIELRVLAFLAGELALIEMENDPEVDIHRAITSLITGKEMCDISAGERNDKKRVNFGIVYMMSEYGLTIREVGIKYTQEQLLKNRDAITDFFNGLPHIKEFVSANEKQIREKGYIKTVCGRYRYFKEILEPDCDEKTKKSYVRKGNNMPVQGFAADALKMAECKMQEYIEEKGWDKVVDCHGEQLPMVRLMLSIHDEVLLSSHKSIPIEEIIIMFKECMELDFEGAPAFFAAPAMVTNWFDGKDDAFEIPLLFRDKVIEEWGKGNKILHTDTYMETRDEDLLSYLKDKTNELRELLTEEDYHKGVLKIRPEVIQEAKSKLTFNDLELFTKHLMSPTENFVGDERDTIIVERILNSKFSPYLHDLNEYRRGRLTSYMEDLIAKHVTPEEVSKNVRHPDLTHVLISAFVDKKQAAKMEHRDVVALAVEKYFETRGSVVPIAVDNTDVVEDNIIKTQLGDFTELQDYMHFDERGELIVEDEMIDTELLQDADPYHESITTMEDFRIEKTYVFYLSDKVMIDFTGDKLDYRADAIHKELLEMSNVNDFYECYYTYGDKSVRAGFKLPYKPKDVEAICKKHLDKEQQNIS